MIAPLTRRFMTLAEFKSSLQNPSPPQGINKLLGAMWYDAKSNWNKAHEIAQEIEMPDGSWVHAYLHRVEGDESNAGYWYHRAGRKFSKLSLEKEWEEIVNEFLKS